jgi:Cytochrome P450
MFSRTGCHLFASKIPKTKTVRHKNYFKKLQRKTKDEVKIFDIQPAVINYNLVPNKPVTFYFSKTTFRYETTASALIFTTYLLAKHPEIQQRLHQEIDQKFDDNTK